MAGLMHGDAAVDARHGLNAIAQVALKRKGAARQQQKEKECDSSHRLGLHCGVPGEIQFFTVGTSSIA
jgi:hypothetical protein